MDWKLKDYREYYGDKLKGVDDFDLAESVRTEFYPDMKPADFYKEFGLDSGRGAIGRGLAKGIEQNIGAVVEGVPAIYHAATGNDEKARAALTAYQRRLAATEARNPSRVQDFTEIGGDGIADTASRAASYAGESFGQLFPSLAMVIAGGGIGGGAAKLAGQAALTGTARALGAGAAGYALNTTESFANLGEDGQMRPGAAMVTGAIKSALDALPAVQFLKRGAGELGEATVAAATKRLAEKFGVTVAKDASLEGLTEGAQEFVDQTAARLEGLASSYDFVKIVDNAVRGAIGAGPVAGVQAARGRSADRSFIDQNQQIDDYKPHVDAADAEAQQALKDFAAMGEDLAPQGFQDIPADHPVVRAQAEARQRQADEEAQRLEFGGAQFEDSAASRFEQQAEQQADVTRDGLLNLNREQTINEPDQLAQDLAGNTQDQYEKARQAGIGPAGERTVGPRNLGMPINPIEQAGDDVVKSIEEELADSTRKRQTEAITRLADIAAKSTEGIVAVAPALGPDVAALQQTVQALAEHNIDAAGTQQAATAKGSVNEAQALQEKLEAKLDKAKGPQADQVRALGTPRVVGTVADAVVFEVGGKRFRTPVGSMGKIIELKGNPPGFKPIEGAQPIGPTQVSELEQELTQIPTVDETMTALLAEQEPVVEAPETKIADVGKSALRPTVMFDGPAEPVAPVAPKSNLVKAEDAKPVKVVEDAETSPELADKVLRNLNEMHSTLMEKLAAAKPGKKQPILNEIAKIAAAQKKRRQAIARPSALPPIAEDSTPHEVSEAVVVANEQQNTAVPDDVVVEKSGQAEHSNAIAAALAQDQYERAEALPDQFTRAEAEAAGVHPDFLDALEATNGKYEKAELQDFLALNTEAVPGEAQPSPTKSDPGTSNTAEILNLARKLGGDGIILTFDPNMKWAGLAWNNRVVMGQKGTRTEQLLTAAHEVGGHALGHMGKISRAEAKRLMSPEGQKSLKRIIRQAIRDGHPTLSATGMKGILDHAEAHGKTEIVAFGVEAAMWYRMNGKPVPMAPQGFQAFVNRVLDAIYALANAVGGPRWADVVRGLGFSREYTYLTDIVNGKMAGRSKGTFPPLGATTSAFTAELGYTEQKIAELADGVLSAQSAMRRAQATGNKGYAEQLGARIQQLKDAAHKLEAKPSPFDPAIDTQAAEAIKFQEAELARTLHGEAVAGDKLPWFAKLASPGFVAQARPKLKAVFAAINDVLVPWNIHLENGNRNVDKALRAAKPRELKAVTQLMEATNAARVDPIIDTKRGTATFKVPAYADVLLKGAGLRHKIHLSKPGDTITLSGNAFDLYQTIRNRMDEMRAHHINSLLARAGLPDMAFEHSMSEDQFDAELQRASDHIEQSEASPQAKQMQLGALTAAARAFDDGLAGYMPMVRHGDWMVRLNSTKTDSAADRPQVYAFTSRRQAEQFAAKHSAGKDWRVSIQPRQQFDDGLLKKGSLEDALDAADIVLTNALSSGKGRPDVDAALELLGSTIQREKLRIGVKGLRQRNIRRRDIAGHIQPDENGTYLQSGVRPYLSQLATQASYNIAHPQIMAAMRELPPDLANYAQKAMIDAYLSPELGVARAKALAFAWTIGGNPSSMLLNLPQLVLTTIPTLGSQHGHFKAWREVTKAVQQAVSEMGKSGELFTTDAPSFFELGRKWKGLTDDEQQFMQAALAGGLIDQGLATDTSGLLSGEGLHNQAAHVARKFGAQGLQVMGKMFGLSEQINRAGTLLASYRLAKQAKPSALKAYMKDSYGGENRKYAAYTDNLPAQYAMTVMQQTQGVFNKANRPVWMQGWMGIPTQFQQFPVFMIESMLRPFMSSPDGKKYISTKEGKKFLGSMLAGLWFFGGFMAMPMAGSVDELTKKLTEMLGPLGVPRVELEHSIRAGLDDILQAAGFSPKEAGTIQEALSRGAPRMVGLDISKRVAIDLGITDFLFNADPTNYLGPFGSITLGSVAAAHDYVREGNDTMALLQFMPVVARNLVKAAALTDFGSDLGIAPAGGGDIIGRTGVGLSGAGKATSHEVAGVALGFTPARMARERETVEELKAPGAKDARERFNNLAADYLFFSQRAKDAGRDSEAADYMKRYEAHVKDAVERDRDTTNPGERLIKSSDSFRSAILERLEQRRSGQLGPAGAGKGKVERQFAQDRAKRWVNADRE